MVKEWRGREKERRGQKEPLAKHSNLARSITHETIASDRAVSLESRIIVLSCFYFFFLSLKCIMIEKNK